MNFLNTITEATEKMFDEPLMWQIVGPVATLIGILFLIAYRAEKRNQRVREKPHNDTRKKTKRVSESEDREESENHDFSYPPKNANITYDAKYFYTRYYDEENLGI